MTDGRGVDVAIEAVPVFLQRLISVRRLIGVDGTVAFVVCMVESPVQFDLDTL